MIYVVKAYRLSLVAINCKDMVKMGYRWRKDKLLTVTCHNKKWALYWVSAYMRVDKGLGTQTKYKYTLITKREVKKHGKR